MEKAGLCIIAGFGLAIPCDRIKSKGPILAIFSNRIFGFLFRNCDGVNKNHFLNVLVKDSCDPKPKSNAISIIRLFEFNRSRAALVIRRLSTYFSGCSPKSALNIRWKWYLDRALLAASEDKSIFSSRCDSIYSITWFILSIWFKIVSRSIY